MRIVQYQSNTFRAQKKWHIVELSFSKKSITPYFTHNTKTTLNQLHL